MPWRGGYTRKSEGQKNVCLATGGEIHGEVQTKKKKRRGWMWATNVPRYTARAANSRTARATTRHTQPTAKRYTVGCHKETGPGHTTAPNTHKHTHTLTRAPAMRPPPTRAHTRTFPWSTAHTAQSPARPPARPPASPPAPSHTQQPLHSSTAASRKKCREGEEEEAQQQLRNIFCGPRSARPTRTRSG